MRPAIDRLFARLSHRPSGECWIWPGATNGVGYGVIGAGGRGNGNLLVHRVTYEHLVGPIPGGLVLDHLCRNRACCNPEHLEPVTQRTNLLRGTGWGARNAAATHCPAGHPYDAENTHRSKLGRECRACHRNRERARRARLRSVS